MAEQYPLGLHKIVYKSTGFKKELTIFVDLHRPDTGREPSIILTEMEEGLYYFEYNFTNKGVYSGIFYENGVKVTSQNFRIDDESSSAGAVRIVQRGSRIINL